MGLVAIHVVSAYSVVNKTCSCGLMPLCSLAEIIIVFVCCVM